MFPNDDIGAVCFNHGEGSFAFVMLLEAWENPIDKALRKLAFIENYNARSMVPLEHLKKT
jgi:hypothetical protein